MLKHFSTLSTRKIRHSPKAQANAKLLQVVKNAKQRSLKEPSRKPAPRQRVGQKRKCKADDTANKTGMDDLHDNSSLSDEPKDENYMQIDNAYGGVVVEETANKTGISDDEDDNGRADKPEDEDEMQIDADGTMIEDNEAFSSYGGGMVVNDVQIVGEVVLDQASFDNFIIIDKDGKTIDLPLSTCQ